MGHRTPSLLLLLAAAGAPLAAADAQPPSAKFDRVVLTTDIHDPMELTCLPDGRVLWVERTGKVKVWKPDGTTVLAADLPVFWNNGGGGNEAGLLGVTSDPAFAKNGWIYCQYSPKDKPYSRVSRFTLTGDKLDPASEKTLIEWPMQRHDGGHHGGSLAFGPDGCLYIGVGDNATPFESDGRTPIDEREGRASKDAQATSANTDDLRGKILRIKPTADGGYEIPKGNLFPPGTDKTRPEIFAMGLRNPFRIAVNRKTGVLTWGNVGPDAGKDDERGPRGYDEFDRTTTAGNFGWPYAIADNQAYADYDFATKKLGPKFDPAHPVNESPNNTGLRELPPARAAWIYYPYGKSDRFPWLGEGGRTAMGGPTYRFDDYAASPRKFPRWYDGRVFLYEWTREKIWTLDVADDGAIRSVEPFLPDVRIRKPMDMEFGPDGALYVLEYGTVWYNTKDEALVRIEYANGNRPPTAVLDVDVVAGADPLTVKASAKRSSDRDGDAIAYAWRSSGAPGTATTPEATFTYAKPGHYELALTVTDDKGLKAEATQAIDVGNAYPRVTIAAPAASSFIRWGEAMPYEVAVADEDGSTEKGTIDEAKLSVRLRYRRGVHAAAGHEAATNEAGADDPRRARLAASDCFACHQVDKTSVGPTYVRVAARYRGDQQAPDKLAQKIIAGGAGTWGAVPMAPHPQLKPEDAKEMAGWILSLADQPETLTGAVGSFTCMPKPERDAWGAYVLSAAYTDRGAKGAPPLTTTVERVIRSPLQRVEDADELHEVKLEHCSEGGQSAGFIDHGDWIRYGDVDLAGVTKLAARVASAGSGGAIELRRGKPDGELVATLKVEPTGDWQKWTTVDGPVTATSGAADVYLVFVNPGKGGLMNIEWVEFIR